jgi:hypothetical protein
VVVDSIPNKLLFGLAVVVADIDGREPCDVGPDWSISIRLGLTGATAGGEFGAAWKSANSSSVTNNTKPHFSPS